MRKGQRKPAGRVVILVAPDLVLLDLAGPLEVFCTATYLGARYETVVSSWDGSDVTSCEGVRVGVQAPLSEAGRCDTLLVAGTAPAAVPDEARLDALRSAALGARRVVSVCSGALVLGAAGLLSGRRATTHWQLCPRLADMSEQITVDPDATYVVDGSVATSAGVATGIDLALALVEADHGAYLAALAARELVVVHRRTAGQAQLTSAGRSLTAQSRPVVEAVRLMTADPTGDHVASTLATAVGVSSRHLARLFLAEVGASPARFLEQVRVEEAQRRLEDSDDPLDVVARASGFGSVETMRRAFHRRTGVTPGAYRSELGPANAVRHASAAWTPS